jgi:hypothetical protein
MTTVQVCTGLVEQQIRHHCVVLTVADELYTTAWTPLNPSSPPLSSLMHTPCLSTNAPEHAREDQLPYEYVYTNPTGPYEVNPLSHGSDPLFNHVTRVSQ